MQCNIRNKSNGQQCGRTHHSGRTAEYAGGVVYMCASHHMMWCAGTLVLDNTTVYVFTPKVTEDMTQKLPFYMEGTTTKEDKVDNDIHTRAQEQHQWREDLRDTMQTMSLAELMLDNNNLLCRACDGKGVLPQYAHIDNGKCWRCGGSKFEAMATNKQNSLLFALVGDAKRGFKFLSTEQAYQINTTKWLKINASVLIWKLIDRMDWASNTVCDVRLLDMRLKMERLGEAFNLNKALFTEDQVKRFNAKLREMLELVESKTSGMSKKQRWVKANEWYLKMEAWFGNKTETA